MPASAYRFLEGSQHPHPHDHVKLHATDANEQMTVTLMLRRKSGHAAAQPESVGPKRGPRPSRDAFAAQHGADPAELDAVAAFARSAGLEVRESDSARRTVIVHGSAAAVQNAFGVQLNNYRSSQGVYRSHDDKVRLPAAIADYVEAVVGLTNRKVLATHFSTARAARARAQLDPPNTQALTPAQVASFYNFPPGDGAGQTIGLYEMETGSGPAGYSAADIAATMAALGNLPVPNIVDVPVGATTNSGTSDGETGLDITVAGAIAPKATIAVYFAGPQTQDILNALQQMIHPTPGAPAPSVISISYGWGADDKGTQNFSDNEWVQLTKLFEDAATNKISVFVSSGDSGAFVQDPRQAQVSYPGSEVWVTSCGGTTIGNVNGANFDEWVWNDRGSGPAATGGGISARFDPPAYQSSVTLPTRNNTGQAGRGVPDIAGNASENSGYLQVTNNSAPGPVGGTSAVAPLYAGLLARINANNGFPAGFLNNLLYGLPASAFNKVVGPPGPANNNFGQVEGYPATPVWNGCTGLGSVNGQTLQAAIAASAGPAPAPAPPAPASQNS